jgi:hemerythrin superfamily protein
MKTLLKFSSSLKLAKKDFLKITSFKFTQKDNNSFDNLKEKAQDLKDKVQDKAQNLKENFQGTTQDLKDKAQNLKENLEGTTQDLKNKAQDKAQEMKGQAQDKLKDNEFFDSTYSDMYTNLKEELKSSNTPIDELIIQDHKDIMSFMEEFEKTKVEADAMKWLRQFIWELARHSIAEEIILYPMYKDRIPKGSEYWNKSLEDHRKVKTLLSEIEGTTDLSKIRSRMKEVKDSLSKHVEMEENEIIPLIKKNFSEEDRKSVGNTFLRRKLIVPTRPHTYAPDSYPTMESLFGLFLAPLDKFRDIFYAKFPDQEAVNRIKQDNAKH